MSVAEHVDPFSILFTPEVDPAMFSAVPLTRLPMIFVLLETSMIRSRDRNAGDKAQV